MAYGKGIILKTFNDQNQWVLLGKLGCISRTVYFYAKEHIWGLEGPEWSLTIRALEVEIRALDSLAYTLSSFSYITPFP